MLQDQSKYLVAAINKLMNERNDTDVILMGDFNDSPTKDNSNIAAIDTDEFDFMTANMNSCKFPRLKSIDHIVISQSVKKLVSESSINMLDLSRSLRGDELRAASDHCPVSMSININ
jgi:endonuclease/exonuclease/phosphatase family metal-dependent hydrolase